MKASLYAGYGLLAYAFFVVAGFPYGAWFERWAGEVLPWPAPTLALKPRPWGLVGEATFYPPHLPPLPVTDLRLTPALGGYTLQGMLLKGRVKGQGSLRDLALFLKGVEVGAWLPDAQGLLSGRVHIDGGGVRFALSFRGKVVIAGEPLRFQAVAVEGRWREGAEMTLFLKEGDLKGKVKLWLSPAGELKGRAEVHATEQASPVVRALFSGKRAFTLGQFLREARE